MTDTAAAQLSTLQQLLADLEAIENNFHGLADPQLAIGTKMREILTETVKVVHDLEDVAEGAKADADNALAMAQCAKDAAQGVAEHLSTLESKISSLESRASSAESRLASLEKPAAQTGTQPAGQQA